MAQGNGHTAMAKAITTAMATAMAKGAENAI